MPVETSTTVKYRADQIGSMLRPPDLLAARSNGTDPETLRALEDRHILRVLSKQKELGFEIFSDGELRRRNFMSTFTDAVDGFDMTSSVRRDWGATGNANATPVAHVTGIVNRKLQSIQTITASELPFLQQHRPGDIKILLPSATQFPAISFKTGVTDSVYKNHSALLWDIVEIMKKDFAALASAGVKYIQIDAPRYSYYMDPKWRDWIRAEMGQDPEAALEEAVRADNACLEAAAKPGVTLAIHLCRGNNRSHWYASGGYDAIAEKLFSELKVDRFLLEYDDERSGTFGPLRFVPKDKIVVLGLISTKRPQLETVDEIAARIDEAAKFFLLENLTLSPQCGFASTAEGNLLTEDEQWAKLKLVVDTARLVWG
ncbi:MAG: cobalamin-independent methionine synthase II family protein [Candidatus Acidiferrales bacterium]